jgi:hypothetical protein
MDQLSRRKAIRHGALAAGVVWTAPVLKSARVLQTTGSSPPSSTTTTDTGPTTVDITGAITGTLMVSSPTPPFAPFVFHFDGTITVPGVGDGTFTFDETVTNEPTVEGPITVTFSTGTLVGDLLVEMPAPNGTLPTHLTFTGGTGSLAGATGHADGSITMTSQSTFFTLEGSVAGPLEIP